MSREGVSEAVISRLTDTKMESFDELLFLSEEYLNKSFQNMYRLAKLNDPKTPIANFQFHSFMGRVDLVLDEPSISLNVTGANLSQVTYTINVSSGTAKLPLDFSGENWHEFSCNDWKVPVKIPIDSAEVAKDAPEYKGLASRFVNHFGDKRFSLYRIFLDVSHAHGTEQGEGTYPGVDWGRWGQAFGTWKIILSQYWTLQDDMGLNILGLAAHPDDASTNATFPPTWLSRQTYPWTTKTSPEVSNGKSDNALVYLMMSGAVKPPNPAFLSPQGCGTWLSSDDGIVGTFAMSKTLFWDRWLLPLLMPFNKDLQFYIEDPSVKVTRDNWGNCYIQMDYKSDTLGSNPTGMENFQFSTGDFDRSHMDGDELNTGDVKYHWGMSVFDRGGADQTGSNQPHGLLRADASSHSRNWTKVSYIPGDNKITVSGYGHLWGRVDYSGSNTPAWNTSESFDFKVTWTITLVIGALEETGELNFTIEDPPKGSSTTEPERYYNIEKSHGDNLSGTIINPYFGTFVDGMFERLKGACDSKLTYLTAKLKGALSKQHRLFLPGSGELLFSQGTFNNQGDFICNVHFNGAAM